MEITKNTDNSKANNRVDDRYNDNKIGILGKSYGEEEYHLV